VIPAFIIEQPTRIAFGEGRLEQLAHDVKGLAGPRARVLLVADQGVARAGLIDRALEALARRPNDVTVHADLAGEPRAAEVDEVAALARGTDALLIVGLGGGSALDLAKLAAAIAPGENPVEAYALAARALPVDPLPVICIPTTAGTGAEVTRTAVFANGAGRKVWAWGDALRPRLALLDPKLSIGLPSGITALTGLDALVHGIEAATNRRGNAFTDAHALHAVRLVVEHLPVVAERPDDLAARGGMLCAACLAGLAIDGAGTAIAHALGHALGSVAGMAHGRAVALSLRAALAWNAEGSPRRHRAVAEVVGLMPDPDDARLGPALAARYDQLLRALGVPVDVGWDGLGPRDAERLREMLLAPENRPMLDANARQVTGAFAERLIGDLLSAV
jgi:alcohol dehydrogenase class IV